MNTAVYTCPFVPIEWIAAHGWRARRLFPSSPPDRVATGASRIGVCPFARSFLEAAMVAGADAAIATTVCDQMRRIPELAAGAATEDTAERAPPFFILNVPSTWQSKGSGGLYRAELERLGRFLIHNGGRAPAKSDLAQTMADFAAARRELLEARASMSACRFAEDVERLSCRALEGGSQQRPAPGKRVAQAPSPVHGASERRSAWNDSSVPNADPIRLAIVGGPMQPGHRAAFDLIESKGARIALDATETGERTLPAAFDEETMASDPLGALVDAYFGAIPDVSRRPNTMLYEWLGARFAERRVEGVVLWRQVWCDLWAAEETRIKEWAQVPTAAINADGQGRLDAHALGRLESLIETARKARRDDG